jgi:hypothetical protein
MCPACMAAAAVSAAKIASLGGLAGYGVRTLLFRPVPAPAAASEEVCARSQSPVDSAGDGPGSKTARRRRRLHGLAR